MSGENLPMDGQEVEHETQLPVGDQIDVKAQEYATRADTTVLMTELRERRLPLEQYRQFIKTLYPMVVGFNYGLIQSYSKIKEELDRSPAAQELVVRMQALDHVRQADEVAKIAAELRKLGRDSGLNLIRALSGQLGEEQGHNNYYRAMLAAHEIDHQAYYDRYKEYLGSFSVEELDRMTSDVLQATRSGRVASAFPDTEFSQPVLALSHYLARAATDPNVKFIVYNALQSAIEFALVKGVSQSIYPGVSGPGGQPPYNELLVPDAAQTLPGEVPLSIKWWDEHAQTGKRGRVELQHIQHGLQLLNHHLTDPADVTETLQRVDDILSLFSSAVEDLE